jgi:hypothetical protein
MESEAEELERQLRQAQYNLDQLNKKEAGKRVRVMDVNARGELYVRDYIKHLDG